MLRAKLASVVLVAMLWIGSAVVAQTPGTAGPLVLNPIAATSGRGVSNVALINRDEIRVLRVDVAPGGVRNVHSHDDMQYHLFIPTAAGMQFGLESGQPAQMDAWQAQFVSGGTKHGFTNTGTSTVTVMEIFVKK
jgi:quercetin dioxygenase-like cupin family protein